jgi:hypothetical protein
MLVPCGHRWEWQRHREGTADGQWHDALMASGIRFTDGRRMAGGMGHCRWPVAS